jgi:glycosyltransferase involved in cell wall biosynthesis
MHDALIHHHVGGEAGGGGGVRLMLELGLGLATIGHRVTVVCHDYLASSEFAYATDQLDIRALRTGVSEMPAGSVALARQYWLDMPKVARLVPRDADVVNAHEWLALRPGRIASQRLSIPLVWTRNDETPWERVVVPGMTLGGDPRASRRGLGAALTWRDPFDARRADKIVVLSHGQVDMVRRSYRKNALVVSVGPPTHFFDPPARQAARERLGIPDGAFLVLASGILVTHRRFEPLIEAMSLLSDDPSIQCLILGSDHVDPAYADSLSALITERELNERVTLGRRSVSDQEIKDAYAAADVFVILSQKYAWGLAPLEAIASGTPVILTPGAGVYEILAGRPGIQVVAPDGPAATAQAIRRWRDGEGRNRLQTTRAWLREEYGMDRYVKRMEEIYNAASAR